MVGGEQMSRLAEKNIKLAYKVANKYFYLDIEREEILSSCFLGLTKAAKYYDERKAKFSTLAVMAMKQEIYKRLQEKNRIKKSKYHAISLDSLCAKKQKAIEFHELVHDEVRQDEFKAVENKQFLEVGYAKLRPHEKELIKKYYIDDIQLQDIAAELGESYQTIQHRIKRALKKMKKEMMIA